MVEHLLKRVEPKQILMLNFDDEALSKSSLEEIYFTYKEKINPDRKSYIFLDEVHRVDGWEKWVRKKYDLKQEAKFVVSGSCSHLLKKEYSTLLTGRIISFDIMPLSFQEFIGFSGIKLDFSLLKEGAISIQDRAKMASLIDKYLIYGGFPEIFFKKEDFKRIILKQYFDDILYKDILLRFDIKSQKPKELAVYLATNICSNVSLRSLRNALNLSYDLIKQYISLYKEVFLFFEVNHFSYSLKEQKTRPTKIFCIDNGLRNAVAFKFSRDMGKLSENIVFLELIRRGFEVYYWKNKNEVDFVTKNEAGELEAINVSFTDEIPDRETKGLEEISKEKRVRTRLILTKELEKEENGIKFIPLWKWLIS
jgi:hypothetical protein